MCNLYSHTRNIEAIRRLFRVGHNRTTSIEPQPAIFPSWNGGVIRKAEDGERELVTMSWGFVLLQFGKAPRRVTNVRDDKILASRFWKPSFEQRRCLSLLPR
jgi:putative SOS response-associated peptidase YedK